MSLPHTATEIWDVVNTVLHYKLFDLNQTPITPASLFLFGAVVLAFFVISRLLNRGILRRVLSRFHLEESVRFTLIRINHYIIMIVGLIIAFQFVGIDLSGLAVIFGLLSVGIGFGLQNVTSNFIAGLILLFERPIKVGDRITVGDTEGNVAAINMRATTVQSLNNISIIVPNSEFIAKNVVNWSHGDPKVRIDVRVGVSYNSDIDQVIQALQEVAEAHPRIRTDPKPSVLLRDFGDSSWNMELRVWIDEPRRIYITRSEINIAIVRKFRDLKIEIPFPQRDLHVRSPLPMPFASIGVDNS
jgi:small-conductance mechanosensitive channel